MPATTKPRKFKPAPQVPEGGRLKSVASGTAEVFKLDPRILSPQDGFNARYDYGDIEALAADIEANGVLETLKVRKEGGKILLVNGHRRLTAIRSLIDAGRWPEDPSNPGHPMPVPCTSEGKGVSPADRIFMMLSLNTGKPFTLLEKGIAYYNIMLQDPEISGAEIARRTGETRQAVSNALQIINHASPTLIEHIKTDRLSATCALEIIKTTNGHDEQNAAADKAIAAANHNGRDHATPKDLPAKSTKPQPEPEPEPQPFIADISDEDDDPSESSDSSDLSDPSESPDPSDPPAPSDSPSTPPDPSAFDRLRSASSTNRDGSSGGPGEGFASCDKRLKNIETLLDELYEDECHPARWETVELVLDYLNGNHTIATIRKHLVK